jgi:putative nucleotidyltransferase with HDIG domain
VTDPFVEQVRVAMEAYFDSDERRIAHALRVAAFAEELLRYIDADETVTLCAAYLHDIGIPEAERKYGSCGGSLQEKEGPPVARAILARLGAEETLTEIVCTLVGKHHTPAGVDSPEFRILWDADALVNLEEDLPGKNPERIRAVLSKSMVTEPGYRRALELYFPAKEKHTAIPFEGKNQKSL